MAGGGMHNHDMHNHNMHMTTTSTLDVQVNTMHHDHNAHLHDTTSMAGGNMHDHMTNMTDMDGYNIMHDHSILHSGHGHHLHVHHAVSSQV